MNLEGHVPKSQVDKWHTQVYHSWCSQTRSMVILCYPSKYETLNQCCADVGPASQTLGQHQPSIGSMSRVCRDMVCHHPCSCKSYTRTRKFNSITPVLKELHWLPVHKLIIFKLLVVTIAPYEILHLHICHLQCAVINHHGLSFPSIVNCG